MMSGRIMMNPMHEWPMRSIGYQFTMKKYFIARLSGYGRCEGQILDHLETLTADSDMKCFVNGVSAATIVSARGVYNLPTYTALDRFTLGEGSC